MVASPESGRTDPKLLEGLGVPFTADEPLGPLTWYGVGGPADLFARPQNRDQLAALARRCARNDVPLYVLGSGANLLVADAGVRGVVVRLDAPHFTSVQTNTRHVTAGAGADLAKLILTTARQGLAGLEVLAGIPASVGGAVRMNCGGAHGQIADAVQHLTAMTPAGELEQLDHADLDFGYRHSALGDRIALDVAFALVPADGQALRQRVKEIFTWKKSTQPLAAQSAGCAFKNPRDQTDKAAGRLIDEAGLKGFAVGAAEVSTRHANFLLLHAGGKATDILRLIRAVKKRVADHCGIQLEEEVVIWGDVPVEP
jgi:UDP-N-acetylmuramate dehydrogenase